MDLHKLATLVEQERHDLLTKWRQQVRQLPSARQLDVPTLNDHIPDFLDTLADAFKANSTLTIPQALQEQSAKEHGLQRLQDGFDIEEVVAEYNILRGHIHDLANAHDIALQGKPFHVINRVFDQAIGTALKTYATQRAREVQARREEYLSFVAHDLHTPLFAISLVGRSLERSLPSQGYTEEAAVILQTLRRAVEQLEGLVNKILDENLHLETDIGLKLERREFDMWPLVQVLIEDLQAVAEAAGTRLVNQVPYHLSVYADAGLLRRVFQNLIANAIKYTPGGTVEVGARHLAGENTIECWVRDDGAGIPQELLAKVFDKGESDPATPGGTGLGLTIVQTFTEAHGGSASVESKEGEGALFLLTLPLRPDR